MGGHPFVEYRVELFKCVDEPTEKFIFSDNRISFGKLCFDAGSNMTAGTTITLSDCDGSPQQQFGFDSKMGAISSSRVARRMPLYAWIWQVGRPLWAPRSKCGDAM